MRLHEHCGNGNCGRRLAEVSPPLRGDAQYCSPACGREVRRARSQGLPDPDAARRFQAGYAALRGRHSRVCAVMRAKARLGARGAGL